MSLRKLKYLIHCLIALFLLLSCLQNNEKLPAQSEALAEKSKHKTIVILPFTGFPSDVADSLFIRLKEVNPNVELRKPIDLPQSAYNEERKRYRADSIISYLYRFATSKSVVIGLTDKDISATKGKIKDWGIMGLAYLPGHSCVVSTYRLSDKNLLPQLFKLSIHELGHTQGLAHCNRDPICFMQDAKGRNHLDELSDFCWWCKPHLRGEGWSLK